MSLLIYQVSKVKMCLSLPNQEKIGGKKTEVKQECFQVTLKSASREKISSKFRKISKDNFSSSMFNFQVIKVTAQPICSGYEVKIFILSIDLEGNLHEQLMNSWNFLRYISHFLKHVTVVNISLILTNSEKMGDLNILNF